MTGELPGRAVWDAAGIEALIGRHIPADGQPDCPGCGKPWPCPEYVWAAERRHGQAVTAPALWSPARVEDDVLPPWGQALPPAAGNG